MEKLNFLDIEVTIKKYLFWFKKYIREIVVFVIHYIETMVLAHLSSQLSDMGYVVEVSGMEPHPLGVKMKLYSHRLK